MLNRGFHKHFLFSNRATRRALQLAALLFMTAGSGAMAAEWYAAPNGSGSDCTQASPCPIQGAIDKAGEYDTVHVASGDYSFTSNRIVIDKAGLKLIGETSPFDKPYAENPGSGEIAYGTMENVAPDAVKLNAASSTKSGTDGMIWVKDVPDVEIRNLYIEVHGGSFIGSPRAKEGVVATGAVSGLKLDNNYIKAVSGSSILGVSINLPSGDDSSVPSGEARASAQYVEITNNVVEPKYAGSSSSAFKRAIAMQNSAGLVEGNQVAGHTHDVWLQSSKGNNEYPLNFIDNWFFGRQQLYLTGRSGLTENLVEGNHFDSSIVLDLGPGGFLSPGYGNGSEAHGLRIMGNSNVPTIARNNVFDGFGDVIRALWVQNATEVLIEGNVFTPESGQSDFTSIVVGNREVWNGLPAPRAFDVTIRGNTFHANGATSGNKGKAILFVNDNDGNNDATFTKAIVGGTDAADANQFDSDIGWYIALDDRSCNNTENHTGSNCNGTASYPIGLGIAYSGGSNASSNKSPFKWDIQAEGNSFGGVAMADMDEAEFDAVMDKTWASHNATTAPNEVGQVLYNWTAPLITTGTIEFAEDEFTYNGSAQALSATLSEDSSAVCMLMPDTVTEVGSHDIDAHCIGNTHDVSDSLQVAVDKGNTSIVFSSLSFDYDAGTHVVTAHLDAEPATDCPVTGTVGPGVGDYTVNAAACEGDNYRAPSAAATATVLPLAAVDVVYVDADFAGIFGDPASFVGIDAPDCEAASATYGDNAFESIAAALSRVDAGGTVCVAPGIYAESSAIDANLIIDKPVSLYGAQAGADARTRSDDDASVIIPAVQTSPNYEGDGGTLVRVASDDVVVSGFVLDGDNPGLQSGLVMGDADPDVAIGVAATGSHIGFYDNVVRNLVYAGFYGYNYPLDLPAGTGNTIRHNRFQNMDAPSEWGMGVIVAYNFYADISENLFDDVRIGVQTNYFNKAAPGGTDAFIRDNEIHASTMGVYFHYFEKAGSPFEVSGNQISAVDNLHADILWNGISVSNFLDDTTGYVQDNLIDGSALSGSDRDSVGYRVVLISTSQADDLTIDGGSVSNVRDGVLVTDGAFFAGAADNIVVKGTAVPQTFKTALGLVAGLVAWAWAGQN